MTAKNSQISDAGDTSTGKYPQHAGVELAAKDKSERYYFRNPTGGISSIPAMNADQARKLVADDVRGFAPEDFEQVDGFDAEPWDYPDPVDSDREVNEHDLWMLRAAMDKGGCVGLGKRSPRKNPTEYTIQALLDEWDDPTSVPLADHDALQQADGIGPHRAIQVVGAAVANGLIERPVRRDS
ncbi:hypothetical protein [Natronorubrum texcoconense]|uniref:Uncharacterized protein n=1 Tax=Natronorubrum texcoconense TaxID=1095776 RepID=A0A1G9HA81_9EURY|nr:hypothetical protein [Natronorubrum texcoconense]SDL09782.1 hypothetical protein SAMN04515672_0166 [Natronorubrum texcoconense]